MQLGSRKRYVDVEHIVRDVEVHRFREELRSCQHFLVDLDLERARHKVFNYALENLSAKIVDEKLDQFFNNLKGAAKVNLGFGFFLRKIQDGELGFFYAHETNNRLDRSKHVLTRNNSAKLKDFSNKTDVIGSCSRERRNTKWKFYKLTNLTVFAALLKDQPIGCEDAVLPKPLLRNHTINCLTFEEKQDNHKTITCASFARLISICMALNEWKDKLQFYSIYSSKKWMD